jgi:hypothetical protein
MLSEKVSIRFAIPSDLDCLKQDRCFPAAIVQPKIDRDRGREDVR